MNRAERRRRERAGVPLVSSLAPPPAKRRGRHRWVYLAQYALTDDDVLDAERMASDGCFRPKALNHERPIGGSIGCLDCHVPFPTIRVGSRCPANSEGETQ